MRVIIDRFEGEYAVCEKDDRTMINIKKSRLPANAKEGDVLVITGDVIKFDTTETLKRKRESEKLIDELFKPDKSLLHKPLP